MSCSSCADLGVIRVRYHDGNADDYAVCLCATGFRMRDDTNAGRRTGYALWQVWAYLQQIDPSRVCFLEDISTPEELAERGFGAPALGAGVVDREAALLAAGKTPRAKL